MKNLHQLLMKTLILSALNLNISFALTADTSASDNSTTQNYVIFEQEIKRYTEAAQHPLSPLPVNQGLMELGDHGNRIVNLREHLIQSGDLNEGDERSRQFDETLQEAVKQFQIRHSLRADGVVGTDTLNELNMAPEDRIRQLTANIDRLSSLSNLIGHKERYLIVNIPEYQLHLIDNAKEVLAMKVIVGKPERQTPEIQSNITRMVFNPYWNVPELIAKKDIVPKILRDPDYLNRNGMRIFQAQSNNPIEISPDEVDWEDAQANGFRYHFRQDPGEENALGLVKFEFFNNHDIYMHDTPAKNLFNADSRAFSSGCIRMEKPFDLVAYFIQNDSRMDEEKLDSVLESQKLSYFRVKQSLPIYITYLTAWVGSDEQIHYAKDIYWKDAPAKLEPTKISANDFVIKYN